MDTGRAATQFLLTLPPRMAEAFASLEGRPRPAWFASSDPPGRKLGSGGGTAHLLAESWRATGEGRPFAEWLCASRKLIIHGGGQSRRLPAYAPVGKLLMPVPVFRWARGQRLSQTLLDLQLPAYQRVLAHAPARTAAMVTSGDVILRFGRDLPDFPEVDVLGLGMWVTPEQAQDFGVFFSPRSRPTELAFFLQKPSAADIRRHAAEFLCLVDTGMWLLSERAVGVLMGRCGWDAAREAFAGGMAGSYELYAQFGPALGPAARATDPEVAALSCAVVPLPQPEFYHFGTSEQMIESISKLQNLELDETKLGLVGAKRAPNQYVQNARFGFPLRLEQNHTLWVENSVVPATWQLACEHVLTGVPENDWDLRLEPGVCLDFVPVGDSDWCVRAHGFRDSFRGTLGEAAWFGRPAREWFAARGLGLEPAGAAPPGLGPELDIQQAPLFCVLPREAVQPRFLEWLFAATPQQRPEFARLWQNCRRLSADDLAGEVSLDRLYQQRAGLRQTSLVPMMKNFRWSVFFRLDLEATARDFARGDAELPALAFDGQEEPLQRVHDQMFRSAVLRHRAQPGWEAHEAAAFTRLRDLIVREAQLSPALPRCCVLEDQIIWGRSPVRLDLAGGWTDTPPYCIEYGGRVLNVAVDLNGQPPVQVFARLCPRPELVLRSIDLGVEQRVRTYEELDTFAQPGSDFALAKAALALAGFLPRFHAHGGSGSLEAQLRDFGGGLEVSLLAAVPKGSGLGSSSILAATLLATLGDFCGLGWDRNDWFLRTLALEQLLTTGGGWQDQAGAIYGGIKLIETSPGLAQKPTLRWLPDRLLREEPARRTILLYYTGLTRLAKSILHEIVRGLFLNSPEHLDVIAEIGGNADFAFQALQCCDHGRLVEAIRRSWRLNQQLDRGTNPPEVRAILSQVDDHLAACKLLGAGGGGYLLMLAKDEDAAARLRHSLQQHPPNPRARFVDFSISDTGLQVTRS
jgi:galactokinase/mevalonate kinase-like predicted kinase